eukprot:jgi/Tetstr1/465990/TSEL_010581.t1
MVEKRGLGTWLTHIGLLIGIAIICFPIYMAFVASTMLLNSSIMAMGIAVGKIVISIISAYAIVYFRFPFRMMFFWLIFLTLMLPVEVRIVPTYEVVAGFGMLNSYTGLILPLVASATATFLFRQFFLTVPDELAEAARVDGAGPIRFFLDILLPMSRTNIAALFVILFIYGWNQYLWPLLITTDPEMNTIVMGIKQMFPSGDDTADWPVIMATTLMAMLPPVAVVVFMQRLFSYGTTEVIHGVDAEIADGELIVIVGPSGCGKSTLLRMVAGLETITSGEISIGGRVVNTLEPRERDIAMVFQNYALYPHMSVYDNMAYGLKIAGVPKAEIAERVEAAAKILEISEYLTRKPRQLSGGQRQRVAMGRAIVREPAVFLFDEPLSNLDAKLRVQMRVEIKTLQRRLGVTSLYVTHDQVEAMTMADRIIVMNGGVAEQVGSPLDVYRTPASTFVGGFIGSPPMNFLSVERLRESGLLGQIGTKNAPPETAVTVGVRPEHLAFCGEAEAVLTGELGAGNGRARAHHLRAPDLHFFGADGKRIAD